jgi:hypothetical protein
MTSSPRKFFVLCRAYNNILLASFPLNSQYFPLTKNNLRAMKQLSEIDKITLPTGAGMSMVKLKARSRRRILGKPEVSSTS